MRAFVTLCILVAASTTYAAEIPAAPLADGGASVPALQNTNALAAPKPKAVNSPPAPKTSNVAPNLGNQLALNSRLAQPAVTTSPIPTLAPLAPLAINPWSAWGTLGLNPSWNNAVGCDIGAGWNGANTLGWNGLGYNSLGWNGVGSNTWGWNNPGYSSLGWNNLGLSGWNGLNTNWNKLNSPWRSSLPQQQWWGTSWSSPYVGSWR